MSSPTPEEIKHNRGCALKIIIVIAVIACLFAVAAGNGNGKGFMLVVGLIVFGGGGIYLLFHFIGKHL